jgi:hypothetical protein
MRHHDKAGSSGDICRQAFTCMALSLLDNVRWHGGCSLARNEISSRPPRRLSDFKHDDRIRIEAAARRPRRSERGECDRSREASRHRIQKSGGHYHVSRTASLSKNDRDHAHPRDWAKTLRSFKNETKSHTPTGTSIHPQGLELIRYSHRNRNSTRIPLTSRKLFLDLLNLHLMTEVRDDKSTWVY